MQNRLKLLLIGPPQVGKTTIANFLSEAAEIGNSNYRPTKGARIVEFEVPNVRSGGIPATVEIELWDVSGDRSYANLWPAIQRGANGAIFVFDGVRDDQMRYLEVLHSQFINMGGLREAECVVCNHIRSDINQRAGFNLSSVFVAMKQVDVNLNEGTKFREDFHKYLERLLNHISDSSAIQEKLFLQ